MKRAHFRIGSVLLPRLHPRAIICSREAPLFACLAIILVTLQPVMSAAPSAAELATSTGKTECKAPGWTKGGAYVYRLSTPDEPNVLPALEEGIGITSHLLDGVGQVPLINGLIGHDHLGICNWDGLWPNWDRVTFRAGDWEKLAAFMKEVRDRHNSRVTFHVNLTDVNVGLKDYPETQKFFKELVETKSMYTRDFDLKTRKRDGLPYVPQEIPADKKDPITIFAIVNYKNFWDSDVGRKMIDTFYGHLPYAPPILYLDVLTSTGGNLNVGFPDGALGGNEATQIAGMQAIAAYLRSKGTDLATEGDRPMMNPWATYVWLHGRGVSTDDYSIISGGARQLPWQHVVGNTGAFNVSPIAGTRDDLTKVRAHYARLLAGERDARKMPGLDTWHISDRTGLDDEYNIFPSVAGKPGIGGDRFRGDWVDLVNDFYLVSIQELYFIGKGAVRTSIYNCDGRFHLTCLELTGPDGKKQAIPCLDFLSPKVPEPYRKQVQQRGSGMLQSPYSANTSLATHFTAPQAGKYHVTIVGGGSSGAMNIYANGRRQIAIANLVSRKFDDMKQATAAGELDLQVGDNLLTLDTGALYAKWSDGTEASWPEPESRTGFKVTNGDVTYADGYDRMWPDTWSGQSKVYFFSWDGVSRAWKLPTDWASVTHATLYPLTPEGRGPGIQITVDDRLATLRLLPQVPYVLIPR